MGYPSKLGYGWINGGSIGGVYHYGYPIFGPSQPDVLAQWAGGHGLGSTASGGSIIDAVSSITLLKTGSPTYDVAASGVYAGLSPGITYGSGNYHSVGISTALDIGTSDFTIEIWFSTSSSANPAFIIDTRDSEASETKGYEIFMNESTGAVTWRGFFGATVVSKTFTAVTINDGVLHKLRFVGNRTGNLELFVDGVSKGTQDISARSADNITTSQITMGMRVDKNNATTFSGTIYEFRQSLNKTNNSNL